MSDETDQSGQEPHGSPMGGQADDGRVRRLGRRGGAWLAGVLAVGIAGAITAVILSAGKEIVAGPERFLSATASISPPGDACNGGAGWVFPVAPNQLPVPARSDTTSLQSWADEHEGVPANGNMVVVDLQGLEGHTVILNDIRVVVTRRYPAPTGVYPVLSGGCGGIVPDRYTANLDRTPVVITATKGVDLAGRAIPATPLPHTVSESSPEVWYIQAATKSCTCEWVAYLDWTSDGRSGVSVIDSHGHPFSTAATRHSIVIYQGSTGSWSRQ